MGSNKDGKLHCRMSKDSSKDDGDEATSNDSHGLQSQLDRAKAKLAARDASARKYKVRTTCQRSRRNHNHVALGRL